MHLPTTQNVVVAAAVHFFPVSGYVAPVKGGGRENTAAALIVDLVIQKMKQKKNAGLAFFLWASGFCSILINLFCLPT